MENKKLRDAVESWKKQVLVPYMLNADTDCDKDGKYCGKQSGRVGQVLSCPYYMGLTEEYIKNMVDDKKLRIMIIGQEARHYGSWADDREKPNFMAERSQLWAIEYLQRQLDINYQPQVFKDLDRKYSGFWKVFRDLKNKYKESVLLCWNNIDKVYYAPQREDKSKEAYKGTLTYEAESYLSRPYGDDNKSLLQREIEIAKPNVLLFVTGPSYYLSMATAFGIDPANLKSKLTKELEIVDVTSELKSDIPAFWTYHPCNRLGINCADVFQKQSVVKNKITLQ